MSGSTFRVLVTGSRIWTDTRAITAVLDALHGCYREALRVVHGACPRGTDAIADDWCRRVGVPVERYPANWSTGRAAGVARNAAMVATGPQLCIAFIRNHSPGASHCAGVAEQAGIRTLRNPSPLLAAALAYADRGWPVFMLGRSKRPVANCPACPKAEEDPTHDQEACGCLTCHGFYAATTDPDRITAMIAAVPRGQLALRTGAASGTVVIDVDPAHGGRNTLAALVAQKLVPPTAYVLTGSGGLHLYYRHPGHRIPCSQGKPGQGLGPGIDVKADGGYVVLPPSIHPRTGRAYRWAPDGRPVEEMPPALEQVSTRTAPPPPPAPAVTGPITLHRAGGISYPDRLLAALLDRVRTAPEGSRRTTLYGAARGVARMVAADAIDHADAIAALTTAGRSAEQTERDIRAAIRGGFRDEGVTA